MSECNIFNNSHHPVLLPAYQEQYQQAAILLQQAARSLADAAKIIERVNRAQVVHGGGRLDDAALRVARAHVDGYGFVIGEALFFAGAGRPVGGEDVSLANRPHWVKS